MGTMRRRRWQTPALWAMALILGLPALADAQLFPRLPLHKRQKPPCDQEPPVYGLYRQQYYGYFPTCWRRFPPGWGCPSPEAPNVPALMEELKKVKPFNPDEEFGEAPNGPDQGPAAPEPEDMPKLPEPGTSPFDLPPNEMNPPAGIQPLPDADAPRPPADNFPNDDFSTPPNVPNAPERQPALPPTTDRGSEAPPPLAFTDEESPEAAPPAVAVPADAVLPNEADSFNQGNPTNDDPPARPVAVPLPSLPVGPSAMAPPPAARAPQRRSTLVGLITNWGRSRK